MSNLTFTAVRTLLLPHRLLITHSHPFDDDHGPPFTFPWLRKAPAIHNHGFHLPSTTHVNYSRPPNATISNGFLHFQPFSLQI